LLWRRWSPEEVLVVVAVVGRRSRSPELLVAGVGRRSWSPV
jgi:hypothetical protein